LIFEKQLKTITMKKIKYINYLRTENEVLRDISARTSSKFSYGINTSFINELNHLLLRKKISQKTYNLIYRKFHRKTIFNRETNFKFYMRTGIAHLTFEGQKEFLRSWIMSNAEKIVKIEK